jgi:hypothetical protein
MVYLLIQTYTYLPFTSGASKLSESYGSSTPIFPEVPGVPGVPQSIYSTIDALEFPSSQYWVGGNPEPTHLAVAMSEPPATGILLSVVPLRAAQRSRSGYRSKSRAFLFGMTSLGWRVDVAGSRKDSRLHPLPSSNATSFGVFIGSPLLKG